MVIIARAKPGQIEHEERAKQLRDFSGLRYGNITPTDFDGVIEYHDKGWIIIETKYEDAPVKRGQWLCLERLYNDLEKAGKPTLLIISKHYHHDVNEPIDLANSEVVSYKIKGKWFPDTKNTVYIGDTVKRITDWFIEWLG